MLKQILSLKEVFAIIIIQDGLLIIFRHKNYSQYLLIKVLTKILKSMKNFAKLKKIVLGMRVLISLIIKTVVVFKVRVNGVH